jgi:hypothetical protein
MSLDEIKIIPSLPARGACERDEIPQELIGATIYQIGSLDDDYDIEGGGLVIDFTNGGKRHRLLFAFNGNGMWVYRHPISKTVGRR